MNTDVRFKNTHDQSKVTDNEEWYKPKYYDSGKKRSLGIIQSNIREAQQKLFPTSKWTYEYFQTEC